MLLIYPPLAKPCESPAGLAKIRGFLASRGIGCTVLDANLGGILHLLHSDPPAADTWTVRSLKNLGGNLDAVRGPAAYRSMALYTKTVTELSRVLAAAAKPYGARVSLADYEDDALSPVRSVDLLRAAEDPGRNPFHDYFERGIEPLAEKVKPRTIGISVNYLSQALCGFALAGFCRARFPGVRLVLGGSLVSSWLANPAWRSPFAGLIDDTVAGPGEHWLAEAAGCADRGAGDRHAAPLYGDFSLEKYFAPGMILPYSASRGCFWKKCSFCPEKSEDSRYEPVPFDNAVSDLEFLASEHGPALVHFLDNAMSPAFLKGLALRPPLPPWYGFARITEELADGDFCRALRSSGCVMLQLGLESGDQDVLDGLNKGIDLAVASRAMKALKNAGIGVHAYLLFGTAAETERGARRTLAFVREHADCIDFINAAVFNLPAYGPDAGALETGTFYEGDLSLYASFAHPKGWDRALVRKFLNTEFRKDPAVAEILRRTPPYFTSNHAAFFLQNKR